MLTSLLAVWLLAAPAGASAEVTAPPQAASQPDGKAKKETRKKSKKAKKAAKATDASSPAPDEPRDHDVPAADQIDPQDRGLRFTWKQHPSLRVGSRFRVDVQVRVQEDVRDTYIREPEFSRTDLHRNRIGLQGHVFKHIEYEVEREFSEKELDAGKVPKSPWKDVFVNLTYVKDAQIQIGRFKIPFGLDQTTGVTNNDFVYRSLGAIYLAPARDIGVMVHGSFMRHGLEYWTGAFRHDGDNARSAKIQGGDETVAARVVGTPLRAITHGAGEIALGTAFTVSRLSDDSFRPNGLRGRTVMTHHVFYEPVYVKGERRRWEADLDWTVGPASARAEYTYVTDDRRRQGLGGQDLPRARARAWYVSGTWVVTGENKRRPLKTERAFPHHGVGALELATRYERLWFDSIGGADEPLRYPRAETIVPAANRVLTVGVNWTLNRFVKLQLNGIREHVEDIERNPVPNHPTFWSRILRLQFVL